MEENQEMSNDKLNENMKNKSAIFKRIALLICMGAVFICVVLGIVFVSIKRHDYKMQEQLADMKTSTNVEDEYEPISTTQDVDKEETVQETEEALSENPDIEEEPVVEILQNPYGSLFLENPDMIAWISIPDTKIDLPVVQTMENEDEYLNLDFHGNYSANGTLIMDTDSDTTIPSTNLIIHGHNMKSGEMFGDLDLYKDSAYEQEHDRITLYFDDVKKEYQVFAVFYSQVYRKSDKVFKYYKFFQADSEEDFMYYYDNCKKLSLYDTGIEAVYGDELLTLSTCSYQVENGRFVVVAKKISQEDMTYEFEEEVGGEE